MAGPRRRRVVLSFVGLFVLLLLGTAVWLWFRPLEATGEEDVESTVSRTVEAVARVQALQVRRSDLSLRREATGYLEPTRRVEVASEASGRVVQRVVEEGQHVTIGQLLVRLDDRDARLELQEAEAELLRTRARYVVDYDVEPREQDNAQPIDESSAAVEDAQRLFDQGLISREQLIEARRRQDADGLLAGRWQDQIRAASSGLVSAEQRLERARLALERTRVLAPFAGRIADLTVEQGQQISAGQALLTLLEDERMEVDVDVLEADVVRLRTGVPARVRVPALENRVFEGSVSTINPLLDPETGTGRVTVTLPNPRGRLMPGLFAYVDLEIARLPDRLSVPVAAVLERQERELVFRIEDGRALWTYVRTGARAGDRVEIVEGLEAGDLVAIKDHFALAHEAPVDVVP